MKDKENSQKNEKVEEINDNKMEKVSGGLAVTTDSKGRYQYHVYATKPGLSTGAIGTFNDPISAIKYENNLKNKGYEIVEEFEITDSSKGFDITARE